MEARAPGELCPGARNEPNIPLARQTQSEERFNSIKTWIFMILSEYFGFGLDLDTIHLALSTFECPRA